MAINDISWPAFSELEFKCEPRNEQRVMIAAEVIPETQMVAGGPLLKRGLSFAIVYKSDVPKIRRMVWTAEDEADYRAAEKTFKRRLAEHRKTCKSDEEAEATFGVSIESCFYEQTVGGSIKPLRSLVVKDEVFGPPDLPEARLEQSNDRMAQAITDGIARALAQLTQSQKQK